MPDNTIGWGQGSVNNYIGWGSGAADNTISWGLIHAESYGHDETNLVGDNLANLIISASEASGGAIISKSCLEGLVRNNSDNNEASTAYQIIDASETAGGSIISYNCVYSLVTNNQ